MIEKEIDQYFDRLPVFLVIYGVVFLGVALMARNPVILAPLLLIVPYMFFMRRKWRKRRLQWKKQQLNARKQDLKR